MPSLVSKLKNIFFWYPFVPFCFLNPTFNRYRFDALLLIIFNIVIICIIANKEVEWTFHPFKDDIIADKIGIDYIKPSILPKFGFVFWFITILCTALSVVPVCIPERKYREFLMPVLIWMVYTVTALVINFVHMLITIIALQVPWKAVLSIGITGCFVSLIYFKLIFQLISFYEFLQFNE